MQNLLIYLHRKTKKESAQGCPLYFFMWYNLKMKNRDYKQFAPREIYHIYNRGVDKMEIFRDDEDFKIFLLRLEENLFPERSERNNFSKKEKRRKLLPPNSFDLICYCLMPNHFHIIIQQLGNTPVNKLVSKICTSYSMYFNKKYGRVGALFQDQFKAVLIEDNEQLLWASFYVHKNPLEAGLVDEICDYKWNSFFDYKNGSTEPLCKESIILKQFKSRSNFVSHFYELVKSKETDKKMIGFGDLFIDAYI
jgi:putative transposase